MSYSNNLCMLKGSYQLYIKRTNLSDKLFRNTPPKRVNEKNEHTVPLYLSNSVSQFYQLVPQITVVDGFLVNEDNDDENGIAVSVSKPAKGRGRLARKTNVNI